MKGVYSVLLLVLSNTFMTVAWYGHLKFKDWSWMQHMGLIGIILLSWGIAFFEYVLQVPANRLGYSANGGPFSLLQLKVIQEVISFSVFVIFTFIVYKNETIRWNHLLAFVFIVLAVVLVFKK